MNMYSFAMDQGITMHSDARPFYDDKDPITSISMRNGSLLMVSATQGKKRGGKPRHCLLIYQPPASMLIMAGLFQQEFTHAVPTFQDMVMFCQQEENAIVNWHDDNNDPVIVHWAGDSRKRMQEEVSRLQKLTLSDECNFRWNMTLRWIRRHFSSTCQVVLEERKLAASGVRLVASPAMVGSAASSAMPASAPVASSALTPPAIVHWDEKANKASLERHQESKQKARGQVGDQPRLRSTEEPKASPAVGDQLSLRSTDDPKASAGVGDQLSLRSANEAMLELVQALFASSERLSLQRGDRLFTGCSKIRIFV